MPVEEFEAKTKIADKIDKYDTNRGSSQLRIKRVSSVQDMVISMDTQAVRLNDDKKVPTTIEDEGRGWGGTKDGFEDRKKITE